MKLITVYLNSSVADIAKTIPCHKFSELSRLARKETVEIEFKNDYCRIVARHSRKVKCPKKIINSAEELLKWIENKIMTAWK